MKLPLKFSDISFGCDEYGYIPRKPNSKDVDEAALSENTRYIRHMIKTHGVTCTIVDGNINIFLVDETNK